MGPVHVKIPIAAKRSVTAADIAEDVGPIEPRAITIRSVGVGATATGPATATTPGACLVGKVPDGSVRVVLLLLLGIGKDLVGLVYLLEGLLVAARIRMMLLSELAKRLLYLIGGSGLLHAEYVVVTL